MDNSKGCFSTDDGGMAVFGPGFLMVFGPDNSDTRPIRDILVFHHLEENKRYVFLHDVWKTLQVLGEGTIHADNTAMIEYGHGLNSIPKTIESITSQSASYKRDIILLLMPSQSDSIIVKTSDGLVFIGPNDGRLGFIVAEKITEFRKIIGPTDLRETTQRVFAAAKIVAGWQLDSFSEAEDKNLLVRI